MALTDEVEKTKQRLAQEAGKAMVKRAIGDALLSPEEKAAREAEDAATNKTRLVKVILGVTALVAVGIGIMKLMAAVWMYGIALVVIAGVGAAGYLTVRPKLAAMKEAREAQRLLDEAERTKDAREAAAQKAVTDAKQKLEDDLARLKKQV